MKTIEEKAKAYDKALEKMKSYVVDEYGCTRIKVVNVFPELKENEDERIGKDIIWCLKHSGIKESNPINPHVTTIVKDAIAWLKKKVEQKQDPCEHCKDICLNCHNFPCIEKRTFNQGKSALEAINKEEADNQNCIKSVNELGQKFKVGDIVQYITDSTDRRKIEEIDTLCNMYYTDSSPIMFEVEDAWKVVVNAEDVEQEHTDKIEPKFHVGDWIVNNGSGCVYQITSIRGDEYCLWPLDSKIEGFLRIVDVHNNYHLWTIQDAKDGDIIVCPKYAGDIVSNIFIFKGITVKDNDVICHCSFSKAFISTEHYIASADSINTDFYPATKEQRNILFKAMTNAGYIFDFEKKVIKKRN